MLKLEIIATIVNSCKASPSMEAFLDLHDAAFLSPWFHFKQCRVMHDLIHLIILGVMWIRYAGTWSDKIKEQEDRKRKMIAASNQVQPSPNIFGDFSFLRLPNEWKKSAWVIVTLWVLLIGTAIYLQTWTTPATLKHATRIFARHWSMVQTQRCC